MPDDRKWFIGERSQALASLLLTSRPDLSIQSENPQVDGVDFIVALKDTEAENLPTKLFVVQIKGTLSIDQADWTKAVKPVYQRGNALYLPVCVFVVNVRRNDTVYAWVAEPRVTSGGVEIKFFDQPDFHALDSTAVDQIVDRVRAWYNAMPRSVAAHAS